MRIPWGGALRRGLGPYRAKQVGTMAGAWLLLAACPAAALPPVGWLTPKPAPTAPSSNPPTPAYPSPRPPSGTENSGAYLAVSVRGITPGVVLRTQPPGQVMITGRVTNLGSKVAAKGQPVSVVIGQALSDRAKVDSWSRSRTPLAGESSAQVTLPHAVAPGGSDAFTLRIPTASLQIPSAFGPLPISVQTTQDAVRTFIGVQRSKQYEPVTVVWAQPVTTPGIPALSDATNSTARLAAWRTLVGEKGPPDSPMQSISGLGNAIIPVVDASLLSSRTTTTAEEERLRTRMAGSVRDQLTRTGGLLLPGGDPDLAALSEQLRLAPNQAPAVTDPAATLARGIAQGIPGGRVLGDIAWTADSNPPSDGRVKNITQLLGTRPVMLVPQGAVPGRPTIARHTATGTTLLENDTALAVAATDLQAGNLTLARQRIIADTALIVREYPGVRRTLLALPERSSTTTGSVYARLVGDLAQVPWLNTGSMTDVNSAISRDAVASPVVLSTDPGNSQSPSPLNTQSITDATDALAEAGRFATVRADGTDYSAMMLESAAAALSVRWRTAPDQYPAVTRGLSNATRASSRALQINAGDVNFFAESGRLQVTVLNDLDVALRGVRVELTPGNPALRVDRKPDLLDIGPHSRQTIAAPATALAAGSVPVRITVTNRAGGAVGSPADLQVRVRPTGSWIYPALGALVLGLALAGTWRSRQRKGEHRADEQMAASQGNPRA